MAQVGVGDRDPEIDVLGRPADGGQDREGFPGWTFIADPKGVEPCLLCYLGCLNQLGDGFVGKRPYGSSHGEGSGVGATSTPAQALGGYVVITGAT